jgi:hypothetical protein
MLLDLIFPRTKLRFSEAINRDHEIDGQGGFTCEMKQSYWMCETESAGVKRWPITLNARVKIGVMSLGRVAQERVLDA